MDPSLLPGSFGPILDLVVAEARARDLPVFLVGGAVRDALRGVPSKDLDLVVQTDSPGKVLELARGLADGLGGTFVPLDKARGIARIVLKGGRDLDLAAQVGSTLEEDLRHRDFTLNAMAWDPRSRALVDPTGGRSDLERGILRLAGPASLVEDPLRTMRALRMLCSLPLQPAPGLLDALRAHSCRLSGVSGERIRDEFFACLVAGLTSRWEIFVESGLLRATLPEAEGLGGGEQARVLATLRLLEDPQALAVLGNSWCAERLRAHLETPLAGNRRPLELLKLAVLLEPGPESASLSRAGEESGIGRVARHLVLSRREGRRLERLMALRDEPWNLSRQGASPGRWHRLFREAGPSAPDLLVFSAARAMGSGGRGDSIFLARIRRMLEDFFQEGRVSRPKTLLTGADLARAFGLPRGPLVGRLLEELAEAVAEEKVRSREEALALAAEWLARDS